MSQHRGKLDGVFVACSCASRPIIRLSSRFGDVVYLRCWGHAWCLDLLNRMHGDKCHARVHRVSNVVVCGEAQSAAPCLRRSLFEPAFIYKCVLLYSTFYITIFSL